MYSQRIKKAYSRTPGQLLSLTTQFTFSPTVESKMKSINKIKHVATPLKNLPIHFSSPNNQNKDTFQSQLPIPFLESSRHEENYHREFNTSDSFDKSFHSTHADFTPKDNTRLLDIVVSNSHLTHHNLSDTLMKSTHLLDFLEKDNECSSLSSSVRRPRMNTTEIKTPFTSAIIEPSTVIIDIPESGDSVWGTPDYLAPEILLGKREGTEVDWWALGVCFYEFLCGFPPFNDDSVELIFTNIIDRNMEWPPINDAFDSSIVEETLHDGHLNHPTISYDDIPTISSDAANIISRLLHPEPQHRANFDVITKHPYFAGINWDNVANSPAPFIPLNLPPSLS